MKCSSRRTERRAAVMDMEDFAQCVDGVYAAMLDYIEEQGSVSYGDAYSECAAIAETLVEDYWHYYDDEDIDDIIGTVMGKLEGDARVSMRAAYNGYIASNKRAGHETEDGNFAIGDVYRYWLGGPWFEIVEIDGNDVLLEGDDEMFPLWTESGELRRELEDNGMWLRETMAFRKKAALLDDFYASFLEYAKLENLDTYESVVIAGFFDWLGVDGRFGGFEFN